MISGIFPNGTDAARTRVKICGITNAADANAAFELGADALGFNFFPGSPRYVHVTSARTWLAELPPSVLKIAVLVDPTLEDAIKVAELPFIDALQLHGSESPELCASLSKRGISLAKAVGVRNEDSLRDLPSFFTRTILLDSNAKRFGGSGQRFPWHLATKFVNDHPDLEIVLAGGLDADNVAEAIRQVKPFAVDVTSSVESAPGRKDIARLRRFIDAVRDTIG